MCDTLVCISDDEDPNPASYPVSYDELLEQLELLKLILGYHSLFQKIISIYILFPFKLCEKQIAGIFI